MEAAKEINIISRNPGREIKKMQDFAVNKRIPVQSLRKAQTRYGLKVSALLHPNFYTYLSNKVSCALLDNKERNMKALNAAIEKGDKVFIRRLEGMWNPIEFIVELQTETDSEDMDDDDRDEVEADEEEEEEDKEGCEEEKELDMKLGPNAEAYLKMIQEARAKNSAKGYGKK